MTQFTSLADLRETLEEASFDRPPAIVSNAHITGVSVARALATHDVPVIALDRTGDGVAPPSEAVVAAGEVTFPLDDPDGFREDVESVADVLDHDPVAFPCMDEWVHAFAETEPDGVRLPFAKQDVIADVLDKESLYATAEELEVPYPETYRLSEVDPDDAADRLGFPLVVKPARKREFEELLGTNVVEVADREEFLEVVTGAQEAGVRVMAQEKVPVATGEDRSLASYRSPDGDVLSVVGNARVRYPQGFGTSCVVDTVEDPELEARARSVLEESGYYGISEAEFVYDSDREEYVLLDVNTRPWKWISMPVEAGANLPYAAYADAVGLEYESPEPQEARWIYLPDYLSLLASSPSFPDVLSNDEWTALLSGEFESTQGLTTGVYRPSDPGPALQVLETEFGGPDYYCSC
ncbi:carboxylate--amine ligase [Natronobacterium texcoconense]|uniref:Predicted ATP-dependent carboligase, ATP-grasp superfamily n=1 Tax=Natronobacterium texcoconense TaxID=1095778 RepID=A0A1H1G6I3_NATTX|nr:carboxylate--amine ligase [Natronobacterium texcoconense]SDR08538.1 Predicted ATP-dependent carboligase, ATP-grasp superfamily [Natronobacterium texcoconense]